MHNACEFSDLENIDFSLVLPMKMRSWRPQNSQEMMGKVPETLLERSKRELMVPRRFQKDLGPCKRGVIGSELSATSRARPTYLITSD